MWVWHGKQPALGARESTKVTEFWPRAASGWEPPRGDLLLTALLSANYQRPDPPAKALPCFKHSSSGQPSVWSRCEDCSAIKPVEKTQGSGRRKRNFLAEVSSQWRNDRSAPEARLGWGHCPPSVCHRSSQAGGSASAKWRWISITQDFFLYKQIYDAIYI